MGFLHIPRLRLRSPFTIFLLVSLFIISYIFLNPQSLPASDLDHLEGHAGLNPGAGKARSGFGLIQDRVVYSRSRREKLLSREVERPAAKGKKVTPAVLQEREETIGTDEPPKGSRRTPSSSSNAGHGQAFVSGEGSPSDFGGLGQDNDQANVDGPTLDGDVPPSPEQYEAERPPLGVFRSKKGAGSVPLYEDADSPEDEDGERRDFAQGQGWMGKASSWAAGMLHPGRASSNADDQDGNFSLDGEALPGIGKEEYLAAREEIAGGGVPGAGKVGTAKVTVEERVEGAIMPKMGNETLRAELGRATWKFLHTMTLRYPLTPTSTERSTLNQFFSTFSLLYPCGECASHFQDLLKEYPVQTSSRKAASEWLCVVHNRVNDKLGKEEFDCAALGEVYDCGCGDEEEGQAGEESSQTAGADEQIEVDQATPRDVTAESESNQDTDSDTDSGMSTPSSLEEAANVIPWVNPNSNLLSGLRDPNGLLQAAQNRLQAGREAVGEVVDGVERAVGVKKEEEQGFGEETVKRDGEGDADEESKVLGQTSQQDGVDYAAAGRDMLPFTMGNGNPELSPVLEADNSANASPSAQSTANGLPDKDDLVKHIEQRERELGLDKSATLTPQLPLDLRGQASVPQGRFAVDEAGSQEEGIPGLADPTGEKLEGMTAIEEAQARRLEEHRVIALDKTSANGQSPAQRNLQKSIDKLLREIEDDATLTPRQKEMRIKRIERIRGGQMNAGVPPAPEAKRMGAPDLDDQLDPLNLRDRAALEGPGGLRQRLLNDAGVPLPPGVARGRRRPANNANRLPKYPSSVKKKTDGGWLNEDEERSHPLGVLLEEGQNAKQFGFEKYYEEEKVEIEPFEYTQEEGDEPVDVKD